MRTILFIAAALAPTTAACDAGRVAKAAPLEIAAPSPIALGSARAPVPARKKLYLDVHHFGPVKVTAEAVAEAHKKDLAVQAKYDVTYLKYWFAADTGTVMCLIEAPSAEAAIAGHKEAHGLLPDSIDEVTEGR